MYTVSYANSDSYKCNHMKSNHYTVNTEIYIYKQYDQKKILKYVGWIYSVVYIIIKCTLSGLT